MSYIVQKDQTNSLLEKKVKYIIGIFVESVGFWVQTIQPKIITLSLNSARPPPETSLHKITLFLNIFENLLLDNNS